MENTATDTAAFPDAIQDETIDPTEAEKQDSYDELIDVELTQEDRDAKRVELEGVDREIIRLEEQKKSEAKAVNNQLKPLKAKRECILADLDAGTVKMPVACYEHFVEDSAGNVLRVEVRRVDTDEVIPGGERAPTEQERRDAAADRQGDLFDGGGSEPPPGLRDPADHEDDDENESAVGPEDFEPTPEALAQAAEDEGRVVKTTAKEVKAKKAKQRAAAEQDAE